MAGYPEWSVPLAMKNDQASVVGFKGNRKLNVLPFPRLAGHPDFTIICFNDLLADCQFQSDSGKYFPVLLHPVIGLKKPGLFPPRDQGLR
jgi:hypothetical protein